MAKTAQTWRNRIVETGTVAALAGLVQRIDDADLRTMAADVAGALGIRTDESEVPGGDAGAQLNRAEELKAEWGVERGLVAAERIPEVRCFAMEIEPLYVAVTLQRMKDLGKTPVRVGVVDASTASAALAQDVKDRVADGG